MDKIICTPEEAAAALVTSPTVIRGWIRDGKLPAYKSGRNWKIVISQLQSFAEEMALEETERRMK